MTAYRLAWLVLAADAAYWLYMIGHDGEQAVPGWRAGVNIATFYGGWLLLVVLVAIGLARRARST